MRAFAISALTVLLAWACGCVSYNAPAGDCDGATCSGHGRCVVVDDAPVCSCDPGWEPDPDAPLACTQQADGPVIVDIVTGIEDPAAGTIRVHLRDHQDVRLDEQDIHLMFLQTSQEYATPIYLEIEIDSRLILEVLAPYDSPVAALREAPPDGYEVELIYSAAFHFLMYDQPGFEAMLAELQASLDDGSSRLVTESRDEHEIIDVRLPLDP